MRTVRVLVSALVLVAAAHAADLKIKITDPDSAAVAGARIALYRNGSNAPIAVQSTSGEGATTFANIVSGEYRVQAFAPGFAPQAASVVVPQVSPLTVKLAVASAAATVVVSATRTPVPAEESGSDVSALSAPQLESMQPVSAAEVMRFLPGAVINVAGRRGGLASLFVRGGDSRYNKVIVDDVVVNDPGGTFDLGVIPMSEVERMEFVRGAQSTLYGSDAMTSVLQMWTRDGATRVPELRFGAEGGNFSSARGYASLSGARGRFDYNLFGEQLSTAGQGVNDAYSNSFQGAKIGVLISPRAFFNFRTRHSNSRSGVQSFWDFNGQPLLPPDRDQRARQNNFLASADLTFAAPARWQHRFSGFEYNHRRLNADQVADRGCDFPLFLDCDFSDLLSSNRAGFEYQGEYWARRWGRTTFGYHFEDENGFISQDFSGFKDSSHGLRRNHSAYAEEVITAGRLSLVSGLRFVHNESFGNDVVPRLAATALVSRGRSILSATRLRFSYAQGIKEPRLEESFGVVGAFGFVTIPNPALKPERNRAFEAGLQQDLLGGRYALNATYFHNLFRDQIAFNFDPATFVSQYVNLNKALAHGAEIELRGRPCSRVNLSAAYAYTSGQVLQAPIAVHPLLQAGAPLLRRPKHSGNVLLSYSANRWGGSLGGTFLGRRPDSDFLGLQPAITHAAGYARFDLGGWYTLNRHVTAYVNVENVLNRHYEEAAGYPALGANLRAGMRFRLGGE